jgi:conjugal transfer pilus assembly protein TraF
MTYWRSTAKAGSGTAIRCRPNPASALDHPEDPPKDLADFEAMQQRLEDLKRVAVMNPSDTNLLAYMRYQRLVMDKSQVFADRWQRLVWSVPDLDYGLTGRPTNAMAINVFDDQQRDRRPRPCGPWPPPTGSLRVPQRLPLLPPLRADPQALRAGLRHDRAGREPGRRGLPDYPDARPDNGIAARLNATAVPALYLTAPSNARDPPGGLRPDVDVGAGGAHRRPGARPHR